MAHMSAMIHQSDKKTRAWSSNSRDPGRIELAQAGLTALFGAVNAPNMSEETEEAIWDRIEEIRTLVGA